jgi:hypothetical protein
VLGSRLCPGSAFGKYVPKKVVCGLLTGRVVSKLGMTERNVAVAFIGPRATAPLDWMSVAQISYNEFMVGYYRNYVCI